MSEDSGVLFSLELENKLLVARGDTERLLSFMRPLLELRQNTVLKYHNCPAGQDDVRKMLVEQFVRINDEIKKVIGI